MSLTLTSPVTGAAQTGFTSPTFTLTADTFEPQGMIGKQWVVSAIGGSQGNTSTNKLGLPFTVSIARTKTLRSITEAVSNFIGYKVSVPRNEYVITARKGIAVNVLGGLSVAMIKATISLPVGSFVGTNSADDIRALHSLFIGALNQAPAQWADNEEAGTI